MLGRISATYFFRCLDCNVDNTIIEINSIVTTATFVAVNISIYYSESATTPLEQKTYYEDPLNFTSGINTITGQAEFVNSKILE